MRRKTTILLLISLILLLTGCIRLPGRVDADIEEAVNKAFIQQARENQDEEIVFLFFETQIDHIEFNKDQTQALVWFALLDKESGEVNGTEPGLVLAELTGGDPKDPASWTMTFQHQPEWTTAVWEADSLLLDSEEKQIYSGKAQVTTEATSQIYTGYKLPWAEGERTKLSGSIAHVFIYKTCPETCLYAFDFWTGDMFAIHAAKGGVVKTAIWNVPNGETSATNYLLIEDTSTDPTTYAIYYHMAYDSIPEELRTPGAEVYQGQFIGNADDTGASTAHHLHFMVHTNPSSYWGNSVDILFDEVDINDGRPRTCVEAELYPEYGDECHEDGDWFYSENVDNRPADAWIESPLENTVITESSFTVVAQATDDMTVKTISLFLRQGDAGWQEVAESQNQNTLTAEIDICDLNLEDGEFELALEVVDSADKITRTFDTPHVLVKDVDCSIQPPACIPSADQIALYTEPNFQGNCAIVNQGLYYGMIYIPGIDNDEVSSLLIGEFSYAILYADNNLKGIYEVFYNDDPNLSDNTIQTDTVSSLIVSIPPFTLDVPTLPTGLTFTEGELIVISWSGKSDEYYAELTQDEVSLMTQDWSPETSFIMGYLDPGTYTLTVTGRNITGEAQSSMTFSVDASSSEQPSTELKPLANRTNNTTVELHWDIIAGRSNIDHFEIQYRVDRNEWKILADDIPAKQDSLVNILQADHQYEFRMRAVGLDGIDEQYPATAETRIIITSTCGPDLYEMLSEEKEITILAVGESQLHTFCPAYDQDDIQINVTATDPLILTVDPLINKLPIKIKVIAPDEKQVMNLSVVDEQTTIHIQPDDTQMGIWTIQFEPYDPLVAGDNTAYQIELSSKQLLSNSSLLQIIGIGGLVLLLVILFFLWIRKRNH